MKACLYILKQTWVHGAAMKAEAVSASLFVLALVETFFSFIDEKAFLLGWFFVVIILDHLTGVAYADDNGEEISSRGFRRTGLKLFVYLLNIYLIASLPYVFHGTVVEFMAEWGSMAVLLWHSFTEVGSIAENTGNTSLFKAIGVGIRAIGRHLVDQNERADDRRERRRERRRDRDDDDWRYH